MRFKITYRNGEYVIKFGIYELGVSKEDLGVTANMNNRVFTMLGGYE